MSHLEGRTRVVKRIPRIPAAVRKRVIAEMNYAGHEIVSRQIAGVRVEPAPGAHVKGSRRERPHAAGTERASIKMEWLRGLMLKISANPKNIPNLGLWLEFGTRAGRIGARIHYLTTKTSGRRSIAYMRNRLQYRNHPGTRPHPFFFGPWKLLLPSIKKEILAAWQGGIADTQH